jgi:hypothetical protein
VTGFLGAGDETKYSLYSYDVNYFNFLLVDFGPPTISGKARFRLDGV